ncbi:putative mRNA cleavage and polyadenylation factor CLP1 [Monocercomonoides exilis]|uniref:putative mRNA cleavage and polyadenylation factor CLP1 n=1 Tax=Monocercomonoides exilis TaxID=2049356 RepID=UPI00355A9810|nr:putative mRNA cleavage and polyadenylation factor CLP1 [Monocercomonoides exilis]|eukprot:MONOS_9074.1-p1 / transcript=MONOS_9074.1 / gene=MONOS_9074 / organism=Monocercomonoides_exilis_PA203 / gene_product=Protein CLP1-like protein / transcript_product=Protein CLP1-like protein / location=Mono_scaffold00363:11282-13300(-) / protein_length=503 / sequence_SO=supercontig / SO=protein_coding / is_pseudo=false
MAMQYLIPEAQELRIVTKLDQVTVTLKDRTCECFGAELALDAEYTLPPDQSIALFSWEGCTVNVKGKPDSIYIAPAPCMQEYQNIHWALETMREQAKETDTYGPRAIIIGPSDSGKSTLATILLNYAVKMGRTPLFIDLDIGQGVISPPGTIAASVIKRQVDIEESAVKFENPVIFYYGFVDARPNFPRLHSLIQRLGEVIEAKMAMDPAIKYSGCIINTCGWVEEEGRELQLASVVSLRSNVIINLGLDSLAVFMKEKTAAHADEMFYKFEENSTASAEETKKCLFPKDDIFVYTAQRSGGVSNRRTQQRQAARSRRFLSFFYGPHRELTSYTTTIKVTQMQLFQVVKKVETSSMAPLTGQKAQVDLRCLTAVPPSDFWKFENSVAAVLVPPKIEKKASHQESSSSSASSSSTPSSSTTPSVQLQPLTAETLGLQPPFTETTWMTVQSFRSIVGLVVFLSVKDGIVTLLMPAPGHPPSTTFLVGDLKWVDEVLKRKMDEESM